MANRFEGWKFSNVAAIQVAVCSAWVLAGCGGGGGNAGPAPAPTNSVAHEHAASIKVEGASKDLSNDIKTIAVVTPPTTWNADGTLPHGKLRLVSREQPASALKSHAPGAFTTLPWGSETLSLSTGTVTDIAGNGHFAIGRWAAGGDSAGQSYNANQGRVWAVGAPVDVRFIEGAEIGCVLAAATRPTTSDGNTAPGVLKGAEAVAMATTDTWGGATRSISVTLRYSIGNDLDQTFSAVVPAGAMYLSRATRASMSTTFLGPDASKPYLAVSYGVHAPTAGLINGLAVLSCAPGESEHAE